MESSSGRCLCSRMTGQLSEKRPSEPVQLPPQSSKPRHSNTKGGEKSNLEPKRPSTATYIPTVKRRKRGKPTCSGNRVTISGQRTTSDEEEFATDAMEKVLEEPTDDFMTDDPKVTVESDQDDDWEEPDYKDREWFLRELLCCQFCNKTHEKLDKAVMCINWHKAHRCYFCFKVYANTEILFEHFRRRHKHHPELESRLICPFCEEVVPYKTVSRHVIGNHVNCLVSKPTNQVKRKIVTYEANF